jgi:hypothetical protein
MSSLAGRFPVLLAREGRFWHTGQMVHRRWSLLTAILPLLAIADCGRGHEAEPDNAAVNGPAEEKPAVQLPLPEPKLDRAQLILAALQALSAAALRKDDGEAQQALKGRQFELRLRFGCPGLPGGPSRNWSYDGKSHVLRARIDADLTAASVPASDLLLKGYEGIAGFTIDNPLLLSAGCPNSQFATAAAGEPVIAVAQLFTSEDSRVERPEHSYEITRETGDSGKPTEGLDLVIAGRLAALSDGRVIHCAARDGSPMCIIAAKVDRVRMENPADGAVLGEWSPW